MVSNRYLIGLTKVLADIFALPDVYTYLLYKANFKKIYFILPYGLLVDVILNFPLGTFFIVDIVSYYLFKQVSKLTTFAKSALLLYFIRYTILYFLGLSFVMVLNQCFYGLFFVLVNKVIRGRYS